MTRIFKFYFHLELRDPLCAYQFISFGIKTTLIGLISCKKLTAYDILRLTIQQSCSMFNLGEYMETESFKNLKSFVRSGIKFFFYLIYIIYFTDRWESWVNEFIQKFHFLCIYACLKMSETWRLSVCLFEFQPATIVGYKLSWPLCVYIQIVK